MKIDSTAQDTIIVELSGSDMRELEITYDEMDYSNIETRRVIWTLLDKAGRELGRDIDPSGELEVEVMPDGSDGCVVLFTINPRNKKRRIEFDKSNPVCIFETPDAGALIDCARQLCSNVLITSSELYTLNGSYRLILTCRHGGGVPLTATEFLAKAPVKCVEETREHWRALCSSNALISLCGKGSEL